MLNEPIEGVNLFVSPRDRLGKPTGEVTVCGVCGNLAFQVLFNGRERPEWVCLGATKDIGEGVYQIEERICGQ